MPSSPDLEAPERPATAPAPSRRAETKQRLRASLLERLRSSSFRDLKVEEIAAAAGVSRSGFYFYYPDKRALLMDATRSATEEMFEQADLWWSGEGEPSDLIGQALSGVATLWQKHGDLLPIAVEVATYDEQVRAFWGGILDRFIQATAEHIAEEQRAGVVDGELDPQMTAEMLIWGVERNLYRLLVTDGRDPMELVEPTTEIWLRVIYGGGD